MTNIASSEIAFDPFLTKGAGTMNKQTMTNRIIVENRARGRAQATAIATVCLCATMLVGVGSLIV